MQPLETEVQYFEKHRAQYLREHRGKYALVKGEECHGFFDSAEAAYERGVKLFGLEAFLIKEVLDEDTIHEAPALYLGLLNAPL